MSDWITWGTCLGCGRRAAIGWMAGEPVEFDCPSGCRLTGAQLGSLQLVPGQSLSLVPGRPDVAALPMAHRDMAPRHMAPRHMAPRHMAPRDVFEWSRELRERSGWLAQQAASACERCAATVAESHDRRAERVAHPWEVAGTAAVALTAATRRP
jgi:hypothetical protein